MTNALSSPNCTHGASPAAGVVLRGIESLFLSLQSTQSVGLGDAFSELQFTAEDCSKSNWDGYGALPVSENTRHFAKYFLESLPLNTPSPSLGAEPDGMITLEWHSNPRRTLSVSVSPQGDLHYAALIGSRKAYGSEVFFGDAPESIMRLIHEVSSK